MSPAVRGAGEFNAKLMSFVITLQELRTADGQRNTDGPTARAVLDAIKPLPAILERIISWREDQNSHGAKLRLQKERLERDLAEVNAKIDKLT